MNGEADKSEAAPEGAIRVLLISGSLRARSTNAAVLRTLEVLAPAGIDASVFNGLADLPHFNPDDDVVPLHPAVATLRNEIRVSDALLFSTPEYAGALPGSFKNLLDWTIGDDDVRSISEKPVAWINAAPRGAARAHASLEAVLGFANAVVVGTACAQVPVTGDMVGDDDLISDLQVRSQNCTALAKLASAARHAAA